MHRRLLTFLGAAGALLIAVVVGADPEFLTPDQAFRLSARPAGGDRVELTWKVEDGYYLYRNKFRIQSDTPGVELGQPILPPSESKDDEFFGRVDIYRREVTLAVPVGSSGPIPAVIALRALSQGCADAGLCYPPHQQTLRVAMADSGAPPSPTRGPQADAERRVAATAPAFGKPAPGASGSARSLGLDAGDDLLPAEEAFQFSATVLDDTRVLLAWQIAPGTYLYQDKVAAKIEGEGATLLPLELPAPKIKHDTIRPDGEIGDVAVFAESFEVVGRLERADRAAREIQLVASYQGCAERGICYPPQKTKVRLALPAQAGIPVATSAVAPRPVTQAVRAAADEPIAEQDRIAAMLQRDSAWLILASFFGIGLLLAFTPCVFPMIPILSGIIAGQGRNITAGKAFVLSLVYVLAMALTYTVAGVLAGLFGQNLQAAFQNPWIIGTFAAVFVALALSMFGFYELQLPSSLQSRLSELSNRQEGGNLIGVAVMGLLSALIVGPCVAPPLAGALIYIGQTGDAVLGGLALFALSLGMGAPLVAIGTSAGKLLPRAGAWMGAVKAVFGVLMLAVAIYLLERVVHEAIAMLLWGALLIVAGVFLGAFQHLPIEATGWRKLWKGFGVILVVYGALMLVGAAAGGRDTVQPLRGIVLAGPGGGATAAPRVAFRPVKTGADLDRELAAAQAAGKPVMLDFYADWCVYCKQLEKETFPDPAVQAALSVGVVLKADVTANDDADKALLARIGIPGPPAMIFYGADGAERRSSRLLGFKAPKEFTEHVRTAWR